MPRHRVQSMGLLGPVTWTDRPARIIGVAQHGGPVPPPVCDKCGSRWWEAGPWECHCLCGRVWYRTVGELDPPFNRCNSRGKEAPHGPDPEPR